MGTAPNNAAGGDWAYEVAKDIRLKWMQTAFMQGTDMALPAGHLSDMAEALRHAHATGYTIGHEAGEKVRSGKLVASTGSGKEETKGADPYLTETTEALVARLEHELGVKGINSVFRRALAIAKEASADAKLPKGLVGVVSGDVIREIDGLSVSNPAPEAAPSHVTGARTITLPALKADQIAYLQDLQASLQAETQFDTETRIGPAGPAAGFDGYGSQGRPLEPQSSPSQTPVDPQSGWQPIATAPKDGTHILISRPSRWREEHHHVVRWDSYPYSSDEWWMVHDGKDDHPLRGPDPTHWMPLAPSDAPSTTEADR